MPTETDPKRTVPVPPNMKRLPRNKVGYIVPWFVATPLEGEDWDFRVADASKMGTAVHFDACWICGQRMGTHRVYVSGPMCGVNRTSAEPPSHRLCAEYAAKVCPFLTRPSMVRRNGGLEDYAPPAGVMIERNPGVTLLWSTKGTRPIQVGDGVLFDMGEPTSVEFYAEGRKATHAEIQTSVATGLPALKEVAVQQGVERELSQAVNRFMALVLAA